MENANQINQTLFTRVFGFETEENRYGTGSLILLTIACLGGCVVGTGGMNSMLELMLAIFPTVTVLSLILAVQPMKTILKVSVPVAFLQILMITINVLA